MHLSMSLALCLAFVVTQQEIVLVVNLHFQLFFLAIDDTGLTELKDKKIIFVIGE